MGLGARGGEPISCGGSWCAGFRGDGEHLTCKMSVVCHVTPQIITSYGRICYSPSSLSNTIVLRNEESFPGRSVLGSRGLHRSELLLEMALKRAVD